MTELLYRHKERLSNRRYELDEREFSDEIVPSPESDAVREFAAELSPMPPVSVPLRDRDDDGLYGWPADGIRDKIRTHGGSIQFGWRLREWPGVLLTAEFHAVWVEPEGMLVDITRTVTDDEQSLFVPDPSYSETFDFDQAPPTRYKVLHTAPDMSGAVTARIVQMKASQRAYEERRARKAGKTLEEWILGKFPADPLVGLISAFVEACQAFDAKLPTLPSLIEKDPRTIADEALEHAGLASDAGVAVVDDAPVEADADEARDAPVSGERDLAVDTAQEALHEAGDPATEMAGDATGDTGASDAPDDALEDDWFPEQETWTAEEKLGDWAAGRYNRRLAILRLMPEA
jgi:hypothetical protein